VNKTYI